MRGSTLFLRTSNGYELTQVGKLAIRAAEAMEQSARLVRHTQGMDKRLAGEVKLDDGRTGAGVRGAGDRAPACTAP
jgi:DNA-binding transcriptional LysR family regulator